ncbi:MAG TPA: hypothetical protein VMA71_02830 [Alloacidobacterium sp.]|nr:hypothetical protein [Alloacidobacterium sp.]
MAEAEGVSEQTDVLPDISLYAQLPIVERFLYVLGAMVAIGPLRAGDTTDEEMKEDLIRIWNEQKFTPADAADFGTMGERLKPLLARYIVKESWMWFPRPQSRKRRR